MNSLSFKLIFFIISIFILFGCQQKKPKIELQIDAEEQVNQLLNQWHIDVAVFDYEAYFNKMSEDAIFIGTDASEAWSKKEFQEFSKPYFDKKQTWDFKPITRNIYFKENKKIVWFDELLETWMGTCRGSGVLIFDGENWKIQHYVLSVAIPNESIREVISVKNERDSLFLISIKEQQ